MDSDEGKMFIGGIAWDTTEDTLKEYFGKYGQVSEIVIMKDKITGRSRGFGFVVFYDPSVIDSVLQDRHILDGRTVEAKRALSREEQVPNRTGSSNSARGGGSFKTKKIFVGGLPATLTEEGFRQYFENYGLVTDVVIMYDQSTQRPRGFGFISFDTEDAVDRVLHKTFHDLDGKLVEVKRALPKDSHPGGGGSGYQGYGGFSTNTNPFDSRMEGNRFGQPQSAAGGFPPYSGYRATGYGYGGASGGTGYAGYGVSGYGGANAGVVGPARGYGNLGALNAADFGGAGPGALRNTWNNQTLSGYGAAGYGTGGPWGPTGSAGAVSAPMAPNLSGPSGYGNQGYGYGSYGGSDGTHSGGYGAGGGHVGGTPNSGSGAGEQGSGVGYMGSGYGEANGNSGYSNLTWSSDPSLTAGGYADGSQPRQI